MFVFALFLLIVLILWKRRNRPLRICEIPKNVFQTHKSMDYIIKNKDLTQATNSWQKRKSTVYHFYNDEQMDSFMETRYVGTRWLDAYHRLHKRVMKTDFWRYCVVYEYGGIYADADAVCLRDPETVFINPNTKNKELVVVHENGKDMFCQWVFAAPKHSGAIRTIIDMMTETVLTTPIKTLQKPTEQEVFDITGPVIFTKGIRSYLQHTENISYEHTRDYTTSRTVFVFPDTRDFHINVVRHWFMGFSKDGWKKTL